MKNQRNELCSCGSGKKSKKCCLLKENRERSESLLFSLKFTEHVERTLGPLQKKTPRTGTIAFYGPNNKVASKIAVGILDDHNEILDMKKWFSNPDSATDIRNDLQIAQEIVDFLKSYDISTIGSSDRIIGCPHEEGIDYPLNEVCPVCSFWANRSRWNS